MEKTCPFCVPEPARLLVSEGLVPALRDGYPVSRGHSLIVPRRHVGSFGEVSLDEQSAMLAMLQRVRAMLDAELRPDGYNIGINDGAAAGQTVMHVHMHVIPRYRGDRPDPRGGIRWIIPEKADFQAALRRPARMTISSNGARRPPRSSFSRSPSSRSACTSVCTFL